MITELNHSDDNGHLKSLISVEPRLQNGLSVLQIGGRSNGVEKLNNSFRQNGYEHFDVIEVFEENVQWLETQKEQGLLREVYHGDACKIQTYNLPTYDIIAWHHGPEHVSEQTFYKILPNILNLCTKAFIVGAPWGVWEQHDIKGNPFEHHLKHWQAEEWEALGFDVYCFNDPMKQPGPDNENVQLGILYEEDFEKAKSISLKKELFDEQI